MVIHIPYAILLKPKLGCQVKKDFLNLLLGYGDIILGAPVRVWFFSTLTGRQIIGEVRYDL